jgi:hypothetical protein
LGESGTTARKRRLRGAEAAVAIAVALALASVGCGSDAQRQDAGEPAGDFPVRVSKAEFPRHQILANATSLELEIENVGNETIPNLAVTIYTGKIKAGVTATGSGQGSFNIRLDDPNLSNPNRPVWVLNNKYPKLLTPGTPVKEIHRAPTAGAAAAQTDTFQFGPVSPDDSKHIVWRVTPVRAGTYPVHYRVAAGLQGKAKAVTQGGDPVTGDFVVTISSKVPETCVKGNGQVVTKCGS